MATPMKPIVRPIHACSYPLLNEFSQPLHQIEAQHLAAIGDAVRPMHAIGEEFLLRPVLAVDEQCLISRDVEGAPEILEQRRLGRLEVLGKERRARVAVGAVAAGQDVERALGMAGVHTIELGDRHRRNEHASIGEHVQEEGREGGAGCDRLAAAHPATKPHDDDVGATVHRRGSDRRCRAWQGHSSGQPCGEFPAIQAHRSRPSRTYWPA
jgi:hypothetical protein